MPNEARFLMIKYKDIPGGDATLPSGCWTVTASGSKSDPDLWIWNSPNAPAPQDSEDEDRCWVAIPERRSGSLQNLPYKHASCVVDDAGIPLTPLFVPNGR